LRVAPEGFLQLHAATHVGVAGRNPHPDAMDHLRRPLASAVTTAVSVAASTAPVIRIRASAANSISIIPVGPGVAPDPGTILAGTKPVGCSAASVGSARNDCRHRSSNEREMPYRRAVAATWRGACKLSRTILSFSFSDQRRRRPVSTTSSRPTWALPLSLSIRTVLNSALHSARRPSPDAYAIARQFAGAILVKLAQSRRACDRGRLGRSGSHHSKCSRSTNAWRPVNGSVMINFRSTVQFNSEKPRAGRRDS
jgi:hypothetical protein